MDHESDGTTERAIRRSSDYPRVLVKFALVVLAAVPPASAQDRSGKDVVGAVCVTCHGAGVNGAPKIGDTKAWAARAERGLTGLSQSAIYGIRQMPPHGGNPGLTDIEIERAVIYMVNASGGNWSEPVTRTSPGVDRGGGQVVQAQCSKCHETGQGGAPRIGDRAAWIPRLKQGFEVLVRSAINGHGGMPPRGGMANLTDAEIRSAITYMLNPAGAPAAPPPSAAATPDPNHRIVQGADIYFGVVPAEALRAQHPGIDAERAMHGGIPQGKDYYHVNVSLFDSQTKSPITDAEVELRIADPVRGDLVKTLDLMVLGNTPSYGTYVMLAGKGPYTVDVSIRRPGTARALKIPFNFQK